MKQGVLFEDFQICSPGRKRSRTYEGFVEKFKPKLTTDDCYTPPAVYDAVCFSYGYTKRRMLWECKGITIGRGRPEWGAPDKDVFIIQLGKRISRVNL